MVKRALYEAQPTYRFQIAISMNVNLVLLKRTSEGSSYLESLPFNIPTLLMKILNQCMTPTVIFH